MSCCALRWQDRAAEPRAMHGPRPPWHGWEIALMVIGFVVFWPVGLAVLFWILWKKRHGDVTPVPAWLARFTGGAAPGGAAPGGGPSGGGPSGGGNSAFEEWRRSELERLEQERKRLAEAEQEFAVFLDQLERAKDREEFERFMAARGRPAPGAAPA